MQHNIRQACPSLQHRLRPLQMQQQVLLSHAFGRPAPWPSQLACRKACNSSCYTSDKVTNHHPRTAVGTQSSISTSAVACRAKAAAAGAAAAAVAGGPALQLNTQLTFLTQLAWLGVLLPILVSWLLVSALSAVASRARQWCDDNPDEPLSMELLGLLPAALENPTRVAVALFATTRVLRNIAAGLCDFIHIFKPQWDDWADAAAQTVAAWLGPFDQGLLRLYIVVAVTAGARVLIKWKTIALEFILTQRSGLSDAAPVTLPGFGSNSKRKGSSSVRSGGSMTSQAAAPARAMQQKAALSAPAVATFDGGEDGLDDFDEAGCVQREGSMLCVSMRPRSAAPAAAAAAAADALPSRPSEKAGAAAVGSTAAVGGWSGSSSAGSSKAEVAWPAQGTLEEDAVGRLLLPLDSILSWAIAVMAGLFAVQTLGINIQPLLAVGGASSLIIGLATQTLLTNAVMGVSIFLSRPFVPGDSITVQAAGAILVSGVVEKVTPMRTLLRTDDDVLVTLPNKTIADMIVYNKSRREARSRLVARSWERPYLKFKVKLPNKELHRLQELQQDLKKALKRPGVQQQSIEIALSKFTDAGAELLLQCLLLVAVGSPTAQQLLLDLAFTVRKHGATLVSIL